MKSHRLCFIFLFVISSIFTGCYTQLDLEFVSSKRYYINNDAPDYYIPLPFPNPEPIPPPGPDPKPPPPPYEPPRKPIEEIKKTRSADDRRNEQNPRSRDNDGGRNKNSRR